MTVTYPNIAFIGRAGSGKTSCAEILHELAGYHTLSFAGSLKDIAASIWGDVARKDRSKLQPLGVAVREIDPDAWVNLLVGYMEWVKSPICVDDCRFPNEYERLRAEGFHIVRVAAPEWLRAQRLISNGKLGDYSELNHISETALDEYESDATIYNSGDRDNLGAQVAKILNKVAV